MPRYKLTIEYDGSAFAGWQRQEGLVTAQGALEDAMFAFCGARGEIVAAGRTDAGVHATGQVAHGDFPADCAPFTVMQALNFHLLPLPVAVIAAERAPDDFHARFSARKRHYLYRIINRRARLTLEEGRAWHVPMPLDAEAMRAAASSLVGHHDFSSFRSTLCQAKSPIKTLDSLEVAREGDLVTVTASARSFLHNQVRILVGTLAQVGRGAWRTEDAARALAACDRAAAGPTAPPGGLYLTGVDY